MSMLGAAVLYHFSCTGLRLHRLDRDSDYPPLHFQRPLEIPLTPLSDLGTCRENIFRYCQREYYYNISCQHYYSKYRMVELRQFKMISAETISQTRLFCRTTLSLYKFMLFNCKHRRRYLQFR